MYNVFLNVVKILSLWVWWVYEFLYMYYEFIGCFYRIELIIYMNFEIKVSEKMSKSEKWYGFVLLVCL